MDKVHGLPLGENCVTSSPVVVLCGVGAALVPIIGTIPGGVRKVKSVNSLVEALGLSAQHHIIAAACSRRGCGRPTKGTCLVEAGGDVVNASLTDSDIQTIKISETTLILSSSISPEIANELPRAIMLATVHRK
ncbi:hypothetical protein V6N12_024400 [Hibiscus sabdariffa]|uniref:Uncharacterized protein n=1 Tax=Hibiscus sabdariffa TaxID=183260 RepID=A0ABR2G0H1_9ROSI